MALRTSSLPLLAIFLCFLAAIRTSDPAGAAELQSIGCTTPGNYNSTDAYAVNLNRFLAALPKNTAMNGGFFNGTVGQGAATVYGLAMCSVDFSRPDCNDCLTNASSSAGGLVKRCPDSTTVVAIFDQCMLRYSNRNFFGTAETDTIFKSTTLTGASVTSKKTYSDNLKQGLAYLSAQAATSPKRFAASATAPYAVVQCTWDLPSDKCKVCIDTLSAHASNLSEVGIEGERKSYSCRVRYSNSSFTVVPLVVPTKQTPKQSDPTGNFSSPSSTNGTDAPNSSTARKSNNAVVAGATAAGTVLVVGSTLMVVLCCFRRGKGLPRDGEISRNQTTTQQEATTMGNFSYAQLCFATDNFSDNRKLGEGSFGLVYKGVLPDLGLVVAVKRIARVTERAISDYSNEIDTVSRLDHPNLVRLIGSCHERGQLLLVYELMQKGCLEDHLYSKIVSSNGTPVILSWSRRYKIALDMTNALVYLHNRSVIHRDIKPSNVLLDDQFNARIGDFGLVKEVDPDRTSQSMSISGCISYMDPEYKTTGKAGTASDVYSFGLVLLEMVSGERPVPFNSSESTILASSQLVDKVKEALHGPRNAILGVVDKRLNGRFNREEVERVLLVGLRCVQFDHHQRPTSTEVIGYLTGPVSKLHDELQPTPRNSIVCEYAPREFGYDELRAATNGFCESNKLGEGTFGVVYKGTLGHDNSGPSVAVKRMKIINKQTEKEYATEVDIIRRLSHRNLIRLIGWCDNNGGVPFSKEDSGGVRFSENDNGGVRILVYELMENGCLSDHLKATTGSAPLDWTKRYKIIVGIASALHYLHNDVPFQKMCVLHRDIKPSNVMLDESYEAKLGDFGLVKKVHSKMDPKTVSQAGTFGYMDPEYVRTGTPSRESDVYSFGVVMLEMALGRKPLPGMIQGQFKNLLVEEAWRMYGGNEILAFIDRQLNGELDKKHMERVIHVALLCVQPDRKKRPNSSRVMHYLEDLEIQVPVPVLSAGPSSSVAPSIARQQSAQYSTTREAFEPC